MSHLPPWLANTLISEWPILPMSYTDIKVVHILAYFKIMYISPFLTLYAGVFHGCFYHHSLPIHVVSLQSIVSKYKPKHEWYSGHFLWDIKVSLKTMFNVIFISKANLKFSFLFKEFTSGKDGNIFKIVWLYGSHHEWSCLVIYWAFQITKIFWVNHCT